MKSFAAKYVAPVAIVAAGALPTIQPAFAHGTSGTHTHGTRVIAEETCNVRPHEHSKKGHPNRTLFGKPGWHRHGGNGAGQKHRHEGMKAVSGGYSNHRNGQPVFNGYCVK